MSQFNTPYQTIQTNHQQFVNQFNQLTEYSKNKNTVEYHPNSSNSLDVELRNVETYYDWLKELFNLKTQTIQKGANYVESLVNHKEKIQTEIIQQNRELEETKNKMKEMGEKVCEIAKQEADGKLKKLQEERQRKYKEIEEEYEVKMKRVSDEYEEKTNGIVLFKNIFFEMCYLITIKNIFFK